MARAELARRRRHSLQARKRVYSTAEFIAAVGGGQRRAEAGGYCVGGAWGKGVRCGAVQVYTQARGPLTPRGHGSVRH